jgi:hypothetical protein
MGSRADGARKRGSPLPLLPKHHGDDLSRERNGPRPRKRPDEWIARERRRRNPLLLDHGDTPVDVPAHGDRLAVAELACEDGIDAKARSSRRPRTSEHRTRFERESLRPGSSCGWLGGAGWVPGGSAPSLVRGRARCRGGAAFRRAPAAPSPRRRAAALARPPRLRRGGAGQLPHGHNADAVRDHVEPARLRLLSLIQAQPNGEACVCDLVEPLGFSQGRALVLAPPGDVWPFSELPSRLARPTGGDPRRLVRLFRVDGRPRGVLQTRGPVALVEVEQRLERLRPLAHPLPRITP